MFEAMLEAYRKEVIQAEEARANILTLMDTVYDLKDQIAALQLQLSACETSYSKLTGAEQ